MSELNSYVSNESGHRFLLEFKPDLAAMLQREVKGAFMIVERNPTLPHTYAQACWDSTDKYTVEFRDGSPHRHYRTTMKSADEVFAFFTKWLAGEVPWGWERVEWPANTAAN